MTERNIDPALRQFLLDNEPFNYFHLVVFERPSTDGELRWSFFSDSTVNVVWDPKINQTMGTQTFIANKLLKLGTINETIEAKTSNLSMVLASEAIGTLNACNFDFLSGSSFTTTELLDFSEEGYSEGDRVSVQVTGQDPITCTIKRLTNSNTIIHIAEEGVRSISAISGPNTGGTDGSYSLEDGDAWFDTSGTLGTGATFSLEIAEGVAYIEVSESGDNNYLQGDTLIVDGATFGFAGDLSFQVNTHLGLSPDGPGVLSYSTEEITAMYNDLAYTNRSVYIYKAYIDTNGAVVGEPILTFKGLISSGKLKEDIEKTSTISWSLTSHWGDFVRVQGRLTSDPFHRALDGSGNVDQEALIKPAYGDDKGFEHSEKAISLISTYNSSETRYRMEKQRWYDFGSPEMTSYQVQVENELDLNFNLAAKYLPVIYGVRKVDSIPIFADLDSADPTNVYVVYAICEGEIAGLYDVYFEDQPLVCADAVDESVRGIEFGSSAEVLCYGRADQGLVVAGAYETNPVDWFAPPTFSDIYYTSKSYTSYGYEGVSSTTRVRYANIDVYDGVTGELVEVINSSYGSNTNICYECGDTPGRSGSSARESVLARKEYIIANGTYQSNIYKMDSFEIEIVSPTSYYINAIPVNGTTLERVIPETEYTNYDQAYAALVSADGTTHTTHGLSHGSYIKLDVPLETKIFTYTGKGVQAASKMLVDKSLDYNTGGGFHLQRNYYDSANIDQYWSEDHKLVDTAYVAVKYVIAEGEISIPSLDFVVKGKLIECYNYDGSYSPTDYLNNDSPFIFNLGDTIDVVELEFDPAYSGNNEYIEGVSLGTARIIDRFPIHRPAAPVNPEANTLESSSYEWRFILEFTNPAIDIHDYRMIRMKKAGHQYSLANYDIVPDKRVSTNPAMQMVDYLTNPAYGKGLDVRTDININTFKQAGIDSDTQSDVIVALQTQATVGEVLSYNNNAGHLLFEGTVVSSEAKEIESSGTFLYETTLTNCIGKLFRKWNDYMYFDRGNVLWKHGVAAEVHEIGTGLTLNLTVDLVPGYVTSATVVAGGSNYAVGDVVTIVGGDSEARATVTTVSSGVVTGISVKTPGSAYVSGVTTTSWYSGIIRDFADLTTIVTTVTLDSDTTTTKVLSCGNVVNEGDAAGNPLIKSYDEGSKTFINSGYSLYDSDDVKYWKYLGWDSPDQRWATRHQLNQVIRTETPIFSNVNEMLSQFNGMLRYSNGKYELEVKKEADSNPTVVHYISEDDIIGNINLTDNAAKSTYNSISASIIDPQNRFNSRSVSFFNSIYLTEDKKIQKQGKANLTGITNYYNARYNVEQLLNNSRFKRTIKFTMMPKGYLLLAGSVIHFSYERFGWVDKDFRIKSINLKSDGLVDIVAEEHTDAIYAIPNVNTEPVIPELIAVRSNTEAPSNLTAAAPQIGAVTLSWTNATNFDSTTDTIQVFKSSTDDRTQAIQIATSKTNTISLTEPVSGTYYYWINSSRVVKSAISGKEQLVYSEYEPASVLTPPANGVAATVLSTAESSITVNATNLNAIVDVSFTNQVNYTGSGTLIYVYEGNAALDYNDAGGNGTFRIVATVSQVSGGNDIDVPAFPGDISAGADHAIIDDHSNIADPIEYASITYECIVTPIDGGATQSFNVIQKVQKNRTASAWNTWNSSPAYSWQTYRGTLTAPELAEFAGTTVNVTKDSITYNYQVGGPAGTFAYSNIASEPVGALTWNVDAAGLITITGGTIATDPGVTTGTLSIQILDNGTGKTVTEQTFTVFKIINGKLWNIYATNENQTFNSVNGVVDSGELAAYSNDYTINLGGDTGINFPYNGTVVAGNNEFSYGTITSDPVGALVHNVDVNGQITITGGTFTTSDTVNSAVLNVQLIDNYDSSQIQNRILSFTKVLPGQRGAATFRIDATLPITDPVDILTFIDFTGYIAGNFNNTSAADAAQEVMNRSSDGFIRNGDFVTMYDLTSYTVPVAGTRIYIGGDTNVSTGILTSDWNTSTVEPLLQTEDGGQIIDGTLDAATLVDGSELSARLDMVNGAYLDLIDATIFSNGKQFSNSTTKGVYMASDGDFEVGANNGENIFYNATLGTLKVVGTLDGEIQVQDYVAASGGVSIMPAFYGDQIISVSDVVMTKQLKCQAMYAGTLYVNWDTTSGDGITTIHSRVYVNDVAVDVEKTDTINGWTTHNSTITINAGDIIQLWAYISGGASAGSIRYFRLRTVSSGNTTPVVTPF